MGTSSFAEQWQQIHNLLQRKEYQPALEAVEKCARQHPDNDMYLTLLHAAIHGAAGQPAQALEVLTAGLHRGLWYRPTILRDIYGAYFAETMKEARFAEIERLWEEARVKEEASLPTVALTRLPEEFNADERYPLFLGLHGAGQTPQMLSAHWHSLQLKSRYISVFPRSSQLEVPGQPWWQDRERAAQDIRTASANAAASNTLLHSQNIIGGFSQGAARAIETAINATVAAKGFIALCPTTSSLDKEACEQAAGRGLRGYIIYGDQDQQALPPIEELQKLLTQAGLEHKVIAVQNCGHWFPDNLPELVDDALEYLQQS